MKAPSVALVTYWWSFPHIKVRNEFLLSQLLLEQGINVDIITARFLERNEAAIEKNNGVKIYRYKKFTNAKYIPLALKKMLNNNYKFIHGFSYGSGPSDLAFLACKIKRIPFIFTPFGSWHEQPQTMKFYLRKIYDRTFGNFKLRNSNLVIAKSNFEKNEYNNAGISNVIVIPEAIDTKVFSKKKISYNLQDIYDSNNIILSIGMLNPRKRHELSIRMFEKVIKEIPDAKLIIIGKEIDAPGFSKVLIRLIDKLNLKKNVFLTGYLTREQLIDACLTSKIFLLPTRYESFGVVFIEAMAAGLPIIAPNIPPINEIIHHDKNGILISEKKLHSIPNSIIELLSDNSKIKKFGAYGKKIAEKKYDLSLMRKNMWKIYSKFIDG